jgi:hypothetical protein
MSPLWPSAPADVDRVEAELVVEAGDQLIGRLVVPGERQRPALRVAPRVTVARHVRRAEDSLPPTPP